MSEEVPTSGDAAPKPLDRGEAGKSGQEIYDRQHAKEQYRLEQKWGRLAGVAKFLHEDPQRIKAYAKGAVGERRVAAHLERALGDQAVFLHDRRVPRTRGNIDLLVVASSGVWIVDAKNYTGKVERRDKGGWLRTDMRLYVGGRDRSKAADGMGWQVEAVENALGETETPVHPALCFVESDWPLFPKPFRHNGVWVTWAAKLAEMIGAPGPLDRAGIERVSEILAKGLPSK